MKLMVLDGNSLVNRAFYGVRSLTTREGLPTNAVYGFLTMLDKLRQEESPDALCVTFDVAAPTFRHKMYEGDKAHRKGMPEELAVQMPLLRQTLAAMRIPCYALEGWEADDLLGTIARKCGESGWDCVVVTGDRDSLQLVSDATAVRYVKGRGGDTVRYTPEVFREEYGFPPSGLVDLKALMGDASDEIPGVAGVGQKTAAELIRTFGTVESLYARLDDPAVKPAVRKKLEAGREQAELSRKLALISTEAPLDFRPEDALCQEPDEPALYDLFLKLEFRKLIEKYDLSPAAAEPAGKKPDVTVTVEQPIDREQAETLLALWRQADHVAVLALPDLSVLAVDCQTGPDTGVTANLFSHRYGGDWDALLAALFSSDIKKIAHNVKDLTRTLLDRDLPAEGFVFDTALGAYLLDATAGSYEPDRLFLSYCNEALPKPLYLEPEAFAPLADDALATAALDSWCSAVEALYEYQVPRLKEQGMWALFEEIELPLCRVLAEMEQAGVCVDRTALAAYGERLTERIDALQEEIYELAGGPVNVNSPKQLGVLLFETLGLPPLKKTKTGYSTDADTLDRLRDRHPIIEKILDYRQLTKLRSTYVDGLLKVIGPDGRVRTTFQMTVTATGRLSSTDPNLQNIPTRTELGSELRGMFTAPPGCVLVDADYSQIELRLLAHIAGDEVMQETFRSGGDIHTATAAQVFRVPPELVTPAMRRSAKAVNFGIVYGISEFSLARDIGVTIKEAKAYMDAYFAHFSGVRAYMDRIVEQAKEQGYVATLYGRRRALPELKSSNRNVRSFGERVALNMPIQGTAADIMKLAMVRVRDRLRREGLQGRLLLQIHDELIVECPEAEAETVKRLLEEEMEAVAGLSVPLTADAGAGPNWLAAKP